MSDLVEKVENAIEYQIQNHGFGPHVTRAAIAAVAEWLCLEAARSASPAQAHEYLSATLLKKQLEQPK